MMELETERLLLQEIAWEDLDDIHALYCLPETDEFNTLGIPRDKDATREIIRPMIDAWQYSDRKLYCWKIVRRETGQFIGMAGLTLSGDRFCRGEISYELHPCQWGKGFATEVCRAVIKAGFGELGLHRIEAGVATGNIRSVRVLEKSGMVREGVHRKILPIRGEWKDNYIYAIIEDDTRDY